MTSRTRPAKSWFWLQGALVGAWTGCAAGWLLCETAQIATRFALDHQAKRRIRTLQREKGALLNEWRFSDAQTSTGAAQARDG